MKTISLTALETLVYKSIQCCKMRVYVMVYSSIQNHSVQLQFTGCRFIMILIHHAWTTVLYRMNYGLQ